MIDLTREKRAQEKLRENRKIAETIKTNSPVGIFVIDGEKQDCRYQPGRRSLPGA
jgi:PAS domain-containing protein